MSGLRNTQGMRIQCSHCGYTWLTNSQNSITSCPHCGWRVRVRGDSRVNQIISHVRRDRGPLI